MSMAMILLFVTVILISLSGFSTSAVYRVGDSAGWTIIDHPDYKKWASTKRFHVGDTLIFSYHKQYHDVMEVSHQDYVHYNTISAKAFYHSGSDSITLTKPGNFYFICSNSGHCLAGQKLHIEVHHTRQSPSNNLQSNEGSVSLSSNYAAILRACFTNTVALVIALCIYFLV